jgi:hypothetical protein
MQRKEFFVFLISTSPFTPEKMMFPVPIYVLVVSVAVCSNLDRRNI